MINTEEIPVFLRWLLNQPFFIFDRRCHNEYVKDEIDNLLMPQLKMIEQAYSLHSFEIGFWEVYERMFLPFDKILFKDGKYCYFINSCSWKLNCEYRQLHDRICEYLT